jgi:hypothetical protein
MCEKFCIYKKLSIFVRSIRHNIKKQNKMTTIENTKKIMNLLLECVKDKNISIKERNAYYSEYLQLAKNLLILQSK